MCQVAKLGKFGDTSYDLVNALSNSGVSMTGVDAGDWTSSEDTKLTRFGDTWNVLVTALSNKSGSMIDVHIGKN